MGPENYFANVTDPDNASGLTKLKISADLGDRHLLVKIVT